MTSMGKARDKIAKLLRLAENNPDAAEAATAYAHAVDMAARYALDLDQIDLDGDGEAEPIVPREVEDICQRQLDRWDRAVAWKLRLALALADACRCGGFYRAGWGGGVFIFGQPSDLDTVSYMYAAISRVVEERGRKYARGKGRSAGRDYRLGMVHEISVRLQETTERVLSEAKAEAYAKGGETALARVVAVEQYTAEVERAVDAFRDGLDLAAGGSFAGARSGSAYAAGRTAGRGVSLRRGGQRAIGSGVAS